MEEDWNGTGRIWISELHSHSQAEHSFTENLPRPGMVSNVDVQKASNVGGWGADRCSPIHK